MCALALRLRCCCEGDAPCVLIVRGLCSISVDPAGVPHTQGRPGPKVPVTAPPPQDGVLEVGRKRDATRGA